MGNLNGGIHQTQGGIFTAAVLRYQYLSNFPTKLYSRVNVYLQEVGVCDQKTSSLKLHVYL